MVNSNYEPEEIVEYNNHKIKIFFDDQPQSPREWDNMGQMICLHSKYELGDKQLKSKDFCNWADVLKHIVKEYKPIAYLPLYIYDHSGIAIKTSPFQCQWDSGMVGYIIATKERIENIYGKEKIPSEKELEKALKIEVDIYNSFITGSNYMYIVEHGDNKVVDSCSGYYSIEEAVEAAKECIPSIEEQEKKKKEDEQKERVDFLNALIKHYKENYKEEEDQKQIQLIITNLESVIEFETYITCDYCNGKFRKTEMNPIDIYSSPFHTTYTTEYVCESCYEDQCHEDQVSYCGKCDRYISQTYGHRINLRVVDSEFVCVQCLQEDWFENGMDYDCFHDIDSINMEGDFFDPEELEENGFKKIESYAYGMGYIADHSNSGIKKCKIKILELLELDNKIIVNIKASGMGLGAYFDLYAKEPELEPAIKEEVKEK